MAGRERPRVKVFLGAIILSALAVAGCGQASVVEVDSALKPPNLPTELVCSQDCQFIVGPDKECYAVNWSEEQTLDGTQLWEAAPTLRQIAERRAESAFAINDVDQFLKVNGWEASAEQVVPFKKVFSMCHVKMRR